ncbi:hypothetical protein Prudu_013385, partial [Prunus dulcis]
IESNLSLKDKRAAGGAVLKALLLTLFMASSWSQCPPFEFSSKYYHVAGDGGGCVRQTSFFGGKPVLNQGVGYSVILGFGAFFAVFTSFLVLLFGIIAIEIKRKAPHAHTVCEIVKA